MHYYGLLLVMTLIASFASFFLKKATESITLLSIIKNVYLYCGIFLYLLVVLINILILKKLPYFVVVPLGSICYIWTMFIAGIFLKEKIGVRKIIGVLIIIFGVFCITV